MHAHTHTHMHTHTHTHTQKSHQVQGLLITSDVNISIKSVVVFAQSKIHLNNKALGRLLRIKAINSPFRWSSTGSLSVKKVLSLSTATTYSSTRLLTTRLLITREAQLNSLNNDTWPNIVLCTIIIIHLSICPFRRSEIWHKFHKFER